MVEKVSLTFEQQEIVVLKKGGNHRRDFCVGCSQDVLFVTPEILAAITGLSEREIFRLMEAGIIRFVEGKRIYACPECYRRSIEQKAGEAEDGCGEITDDGVLRDTS